MSLRKRLESASLRLRSQVEGGRYTPHHPLEVSTYRPLPNADDEPATSGEFPRVYLITRHIRLDLRNPVLGVVARGKLWLSFPPIAPVPEVSVNEYGDLWPTKHNVRPTGEARAIRDITVATGPERAT